MGGWVGGWVVYLASGAAVGAHGDVDAVRGDVVALEESGNVGNVGLWSGWVGGWVGCMEEKKAV